jgi:nicotinate-nucleotide adenylyltransferase
MLHDIARMWSDEQLFDYMRLHKLTITPAERDAPALLHARIGANIAREQFGIDDPSVLSAIERHTVAVAGMSDLEKILYIADTIEPSRGFAEQAQLAAQADRSLDEGLLACIRSSMEYLRSKGIAIAPETRAVERELARRGEA